MSDSTLYLAHVEHGGFFSLHTISIVSPPHCVETAFKTSVFIFAGFSKIVITASFTTLFTYVQVEVWVFAVIAIVFV